ncbi:hypothetical protein KP509_17G011600 [Ceratopteris richardii]|uniref:Uncharacterized protein n=1 Tax=Ceratopteris richardii TaxID=49495 RepID=A0A8T2SUE6_CERRI|nr:hypothetical protein KP509_17G011600 [Ceratopteris richardii]
MAGQPQYHAFHESMLPDMRDRDISPLFLYVWNPFHLEIDARRRYKKKSTDAFRDDFKYWLRFIASKTSPSKRFMPKVFVAITRKDLHAEDMRLWLYNELQTLRDEFQAYIEINVSDGIFEVDARSPRSTSVLKSHIFSLAERLLDIAPREFKICEEARTFLNMSISKRLLPPLIYKVELMQLFKTHLSIQSEEKFDVVANALVASGDLIYYASVGLVVLDIPWFCNKIMGELLYFKMGSSSRIECSKGFFAVQFLESLLEKHANTAPNSVTKWRPWQKHDEDTSAKVKGSALVELLIGLKLACQWKNSIFIPASLSGKSRDQPIKSSTYLHPTANCTIVGRRLAVKDRLRTFLTPGVFPVVQVSFHNILSQVNVHVELGQDVIAFGMDGAEVYIEFCALEGHDNFIDVLASFKHKTLDQALEWIERTVLDKMRELFAERNGIPGVEITYYVIQPACIQRFVEAGRRNVVSVDDLQHCLTRQIEKGEKKLDDIHKSIVYTWQTIRPIHESIMSLLGRAEVTKTVQACIRFLNTAAREVSEVNAREDDAMLLESLPARPTLRETSATSEERASLGKTSNDIQTLINEFEKLRSLVISGLQRIFAHAEQGEKGKLPRMFVITENRKIVSRLITKMMPDVHNYSLNLLCECPNDRPHIPDGQHGIRITAIDDGLLRRGLPHIEGFLKIVYLVSKMAAHTLVGCAQIIPDFTTVLASLVDSTSGLDPWSSLPSLEDHNKVPIGSQFQEGQQWLWDFLRSHNCETEKDIKNVFGLSRVRYEDGTVAWVCDLHKP